MVPKTLSFCLPHIEFSPSYRPVLPHVVDVSPAVVGPLNARSRQEAPMRARATSLLVSHTLAVTAAIAGDASAPSSVSTAVVGSMDGRLLAYAVAGPWAPAWCDSAPQYMSATGTAAAAPSAVRYKCTLRVGSSGSGPGKFCGSADAEVMPPGMALLDVVELPSALSSGCATGTTGAASDSDVEEDAYDEDDVSVVVAAARRAMSVHVQPGVSGSTVVVAGGGAVAATTVWVCQRSLGCWRVTLPWSGVLAQWLVDAASASPALPAELPPPVVTCVYDARAAAQGAVTPAARTTAVGNAAAIGSCLLLNPLLGGGLLMLTAAGGYIASVVAAWLPATPCQHDSCQRSQLTLSTQDASRLLTEVLQGKLFAWKSIALDKCAKGESVCVVDQGDDKAGTWLPLYLPFRCIALLPACWNSIPNSRAATDGGSSSLAPRPAKAAAAWGTSQCCRGQDIALDQS